MRLVNSSAILAALLCSYVGPARSQVRVPRYASRDGQVITIHPSETRFRIPSEWLKWHKKFENNLHLTRQQLDKVEHGGGEWDTEYAQVVNAALPFVDCAAHVGGEGWGLEGTSFGDVQLRVYFTDLSLEEILARINGAALDTARRVSRQAPAALPLKDLAPDVSINDGGEGRWRKLVIKYPLWYGDYGGVARIRFYIAPVGAGTLVLVFMGGDEQEVQSVLHSVAIPGG